MAHVIIGCVLHVLLLAAILMFAWQLVAVLLVLMLYVGVKNYAH